MIAWVNIVCGELLLPCRVEFCCYPSRLMFLVCLSSYRVFAMMEYVMLFTQVQE